MSLPVSPTLSGPDENLDLSPDVAPSSPSLYARDHGYPTDALLERVREDFPVPAGIQWDEVL